MNKIKSICKRSGCGALISSPGYCDIHKTEPVKQQREAWEAIKARQPAEDKAFYNDNRWHKVSRSHRIREPLCRRCKMAGRITLGTLVHHNPDLHTLRATGLNPYIDDYLETLCMSCHNKELRKNK